MQIILKSPLILLSRKIKKKGLKNSRLKNKLQVSKNTEKKLEFLHLSPSTVQRAGTVTPCDTFRGGLVSECLRKKKPKCEEIKSLHLPFSCTIKC